MPSKAVSELVGKRVKAIRTGHGWSVRRFVEECQSAGWQVTASQIENIEGVKREGRGPRRDVSVDELLALAWVLDVNPLVLLLPAERAEYAVTPSVEADALDVYRWLIAQAGRPSGQTESFEVARSKLSSGLPCVPDTELPRAGDLTVAEAGPHWNAIATTANAVARAVWETGLAQGEGEAFLRLLQPLVANVLVAAEQDIL
jgi:transcriptional regulator with XRE-family HTH domain